MSNFKLNRLLKKKSRLLTFLIVCSFVISETALAVYDKNSCIVNRPCLTNQYWLQFDFKFFEYEPINGITNSYLQSFEVEYSTDKRVSYKHLLSASTENQTSKTWAWIHFKAKKDLEKIYIYMSPSYYPGYQFRSWWKDGTEPKFAASVSERVSLNTIWCGMDWYPKETKLQDITHIQINIKWHNHISKRTESVSLVYDLFPSIQKLNTNNLNFSNSSPHQEIMKEVKNKTIKVDKKANAIGAHNEPSGIYTISGGMVKSIVSTGDVKNIKLTRNQIYIVKSGQESYKVAL